MYVFLLLGEFTPENQLKLKSEAEKEKVKLDPWKLKHFEPIWGEKYLSKSSKLSCASTASTTSSSSVQTTTSLAPNDRPSLKTTIKLRPTTSIANSTTPITSHSYTTSSGRVIRSPISYNPTVTTTATTTTTSSTTSSSSNNINGNSSTISSIQHKRTRSGAVTRSAKAVNPPPTINIEQDTEVNVRNVKKFPFF